MNKTEIWLLRKVREVEPDAELDWLYIDKFSFGGRWVMDLLEQFKEEEQTMVEKPIRFKCLLCGRDKFTHKSPHYCIGGYRKHKIKWQPIFKEVSNE